MKKLTLLFCLIISSCFAFADTVSINNFEIKENPYGQNQVSVVATDTSHNTQQNVNGDFVFTINGFEDTLKFTSGVAFYKHKIDRSTFLYARHVMKAALTHHFIMCTKPRVNWYLCISVG